MWCLSCKTDIQPWLSVRRFVLVHNSVWPLCAGTAQMCNLTKRRAQLQCLLCPALWSHCSLRAVNTILTINPITITVTLCDMHTSVWILYICSLVLPLCFLLLTVHLHFKQIEHLKICHISSPRKTSSELLTPVSHAAQVICFHWGRQSEKHIKKWLLTGCFEVYHMNLWPCL